MYLQAVRRQQYNAGPLDHEVLAAAPPHECLKPLPRLLVELNPMLRYPTCHPSFSCGFVERQLDSAGERTGASSYFHRLPKAIVTFGTQH
jgi:hypothetical protein